MLLFLFLSTALDSMSTSMLCRYGENEDSFLIPDHTVKALFFTTESDASCGFVCFVFLVDVL